MMRLEGQGAQGPGRQNQPGGQEGGHPKSATIRKAYPERPAGPGSSWWTDSPPPCTRYKPAGAGRKEQSRACAPEELPQSEANISLLSQKDPKPAHHIHRTPAITKSPLINTPQVRQPAQTAITSRQATIRPNSRDGLLALKCGKSGVIVEMTPNSAHDARIRQNSAARACAKSKICAGTNARNKRDQRPLCGPLHVDAASRTCRPKTRGRFSDSAHHSA